MRCRFQKKIFLNEGSGYTVALFTTRDTSVPLAARDKYLQTRKMIGFTAVGFDLPLTDQIEVEMEGKWENTSYGMQLQVENFMEVVSPVVWSKASALKWRKPSTVSLGFRHWRSWKTIRRNC